MNDLLLFPGFREDVLCTALNSRNVSLPHDRPGSVTENFVAKQRPEKLSQLIRKSIFEPIGMRTRKRHVKLCPSRLRRSANL